MNRKMLADSHWKIDVKTYKVNVKKCKCEKDNYRFGQNQQNISKRIYRICVILRSLPSRERGLKSAQYMEKRLGDSRSLVGAI